MSSRKSIDNHISFTLLMFDHIRKLLNELYPFGMSLVELALAFQIPKGLMITMDHKFLWKKVVLPILQGSHKSIKILVIGRVTEMTPLEFLTKISYGMTLLKEDNPNA